MTGRVRYEVDDRGAAFVTLDAPESRNALSEELLDDLLDAFEHVRTDHAVRVVVLTSSHDRVFSAGGDLKAFADDTPAIGKRLGKNAIDATRDMSLPDALEALRAQLALAFTTEDVVEGVAAFREKREAAWKMR